jgi:hypothetical protein
MLKTKKQRLLLLASFLVLSSVAALVLLLRAGNGTGPTLTNAIKDHPAISERLPSSDGSSTVATSVKAEPQLPPKDLSSGRVEEYKQKLRRLMEAPEHREFVVRRVTLDYEAYVNSLNIAESAKDLLRSMLVDQLTSVDGQEYEQYNSLIRELLGDQEFRIFEGFKARIPLTKQATAAVEELARQVPGISVQHLDAVRNALIVVPVKNDLMIRLFSAAQISPSDVAMVEAGFRNAYQLEVSRQAAVLTPEEKRVLDAWYERKMFSLMQPLRAELQERQTAQRSAASK